VSVGPQQRWDSIFDLDPSAALGMTEDGGRKTEDRGRGTGGFDFWDGQQDAFAVIY